MALSSQQFNGGDALAGCLAEPESQILFDG
jgi:hypothetical protein